jgi:hypothetical protein
MAKFCPECANPITDGNVQFCPKCGAKLPNTSPTPPLQNPTPPSTTKKRSTVQWIAIGCGGIIILVIISAIIAGMSSGISASAVKDEIITQDLSSMALTIDDFPTGWRTNSPGISESTYYKQFFRQAGLSVNFVFLNLSKHNSINDAKTEYNTKKSLITSVKVEPVNVGNEGFGYVDGQMAVVIFRTGNILVQTQSGESAYMGLSLSTTSISDAEKYAKIVASRIRNTDSSNMVSETIPTKSTFIATTPITQQSTSTIDPNANGILSIQTYPTEVQVFVNGQFACSTSPCRIEKSAGSYSIDLKATGYVTESFRISVNGGQTTSISKVLTRVPSRE